jgi:GxxExxY protein
VRALARLFRPKNSVESVNTERHGKRQSRKQELNAGSCPSRRYRRNVQIEPTLGRAPFLHGELTYQVLGCAYEVHRQLGPGLLESAYKACLMHELAAKAIPHVSEHPVGLQYKGTVLDIGYRADLMVDGKVLVELKSIARLQAIHEAQLLTYLRLSGIRVGLLINFNVASLKTGIRRYVK